MPIKCKGCGAFLQDSDADKMGYVPNLENNRGYCQRCFRLKHYNELPKIVATNADYQKVVDTVLAKKGLIVFVVDLFSFEATFHPMMRKRLKGKDVILVANKVDLLPKSIQGERITQWMEKECEKRHFDVLAFGIASAKNGSYIDELLHVIDLARKSRDVYFMGCANVGKSSLINRLLRHATYLKEDVIATSVIPGTTLDQIRIPFFDDNCALVDTPGLINPTDAFTHLSSSSFLSIVPQNEIKPLTYQLSGTQTLFLGGLASLSFEASEPYSVTVYASSNLYVHRTNTKNCASLWEEQLGRLLKPPLEEEKDGLSYKELYFTFVGRKNIWFSGFGFVQINQPCTVKIKVMAQTEVYITNAFSS